MASAPSTPTIVLLLLVPLLLWRGYARYRRMVGRQRLSRLRPWITLTVFPLILGLFAYVLYPRMESLEWLAAGLAGGAGLAVYGLKLTRFERTPEGLFFTPNRILGTSLVLLFFGRVVYRVVEVSAMSARNTLTDFVASPVTLGVFGVLAGYYIAYAVGLLRWRYEI